HADGSARRSRPPPRVPAAALRAGSLGVDPAGVSLMSDRSHAAGAGATPMPYDAYTNNPLIHRGRRLGQSPPPWRRSFACDDMRVLIICRGPIRKEAIDVFREMGMTSVGILLSEKDSIGYPRALSPELRMMDPQHVHPVPDYSGATKEERLERIQQIIEICH